MIMHMIYRNILPLAEAGRLRLPDPLPRDAHHIELWETQVHDAGPHTYEYRLVTADGHTLCTRSFYPAVQEVKQVG